MFEQIEFAPDSAEYTEFTNKFKLKKTTDDCYTPPHVYDAICRWVCKTYKIDPVTIIRPFYPGGDYQREDYTGKVVLDNPPFSIVTQICRFYNDHKIPFFLFVPALTALIRDDRTTVLTTFVDITYDNGAKVRTSFATNLSPGVRLWTAPELRAEIDEAQKQHKKETTKKLSKYAYPDAVLTAARAGYFSSHGVDLMIRTEDCTRICKLESQRKVGKECFGGALLLSERAAAERAAAERAAAERAAAERAAAHCWQLSPAELMMQRRLGQDE